MGGHQHPGRGAAVGGLREHVDLREAGQLRAQVAVVAGLGHHHDARGRDEPRHTLQGLTQERLRAGEDRVLLGPLVAVEVAGERAQPAPFAAGEHDRPQVTVVGRLPQQGARLAGREGVHEHGSPPIGKY